MLGKLLVVFLVLEIQVVQEASQPIHTAVITINDAYDHLNHAI